MNLWHLEAKVDREALIEFTLFCVQEDDKC